MLAGVLEYLQRACVREHLGALLALYIYIYIYKCVCASVNACVFVYMQTCLSVGVTANTIFTDEHLFVLSSFYPKIQIPATPRWQQNSL